MLDKRGRLTPLEIRNQPGALITTPARATEPDAVAAYDDEMRWSHED